MGSDTRNRIGLFVIVLVVSVLFLFPTLKILGKKAIGEQVTTEDKLGGHWISKPLSLGLDLSGGVHLVYQVLTDAAVQSRQQVTANAIRSDFRKEKIAVTKAQVNESYDIEITLLSDRMIERAKKIIEENYRYLLPRGSSNVEGKTVLRYGITEKTVQEVRSHAISQAVETLRNRVDQFGVSEPVIQKVGTDRVLLQMPGLDDIEAVKKAVGKVAKLDFRLIPRPGSDLPTMSLKDREGAPIVVEDVVQMTGEAVDSARVDFDNTGGREVSLKLTSEGSKTFAKLTAENVGRQLAIILDNEVYSSPVIRERIGGGQCSISGNFTTKEATELAVVLRAGALPAPLKVLEERTVGPTLGAESIRKGVLSIVVGFAFIFVFMFVYYRKSGVMALGTLVLNLFFLLACLSAFGAVLTLPGIAGLALTVGMAVDSSVIIFERIRDEIRNGATRDVAVRAGFDKAISAIIDSNLSIMLTALVLYWFGTGPIRGFAVTLSLGIVTTIFCAVFVTKLAFHVFPLTSKNNELSI